MRSLMISLMICLMSAAPPALRSQEPPLVPGVPLAFDKEEAKVGGRRASGHKRWQELPAEKQRELRRLNRHLQGLPPEVRRPLLRRLHSMSPAERRQVLKRVQRRLALESQVDRDSRHVREELLREQLRHLPPVERAKLRRLSPQERRRYFEERNAERRKRIIAQLPAAEQKLAERLPPKEQVKFLRHFRGEQTFRRTFSDPEEVARLRQLPPYRRAEILRPFREGDPPPKPDLLSDETWKRWLELKPYERLRVIRHLEIPARAPRLPSAPVELRPAPGVNADPPPRPLERLGR